jgi:Zn-dependent protease
VNALNRKRFQNHRSGRVLESKFEAFLLLPYFEYLDEGILISAVLFGSLLTALITGIAFHEASHAFTADRLGDHTARMMGRVTLNPLRHLDPLGSILLLIVGFGWGKPVPVNPSRLRNGPETGRAMVAAAGPLMNLLIAVVAAIPFQLGLVDWQLRGAISDWGTDQYVSLYLGSLVVINVLLAVFNLLPIAPLDGFAVALGLMPRDMARSFARLEKYGLLILMLLIMVPYVTRDQVPGLWSIMGPVVENVTDFIVGKNA